MLTDEERLWYEATKIDAPWPEARKVIHTLLDRLEAERARVAVDQDMEALHDRMADLLTRTANALKGDPGGIGEHGGMHSWHDLPEVAERQVTTRRLAEERAWGEANNAAMARGEAEAAIAKAREYENAMDSETERQGGDDEP